MTKLIIFFMRRRFGLKKNQHFRFTNQHSTHDTYYFTSDRLMKSAGPYHIIMESNVKFNWLMSNDCKIEKINN